MPRRRAVEAEARSNSYLTPGAQKALADRLARAEGHLRAVRQMVLDRRCADEILLQLAAVKAALNRTAAELLEHEMRDCLRTCMQGPVDARMERLARVFATLLKQS